VALTRKETLLPTQAREAWRGRSPRELSVVAPVYDEEPNLVPLYEQVAAALGEGHDLDWELVLVDDGSRDLSAQRIAELCERDVRVKGIFLGQNCGQTAALAAGLQFAAGELIATLDADLQNDPKDLARMIAMLKDGGHDAVVGWREKRQDPWLKRVSARVSNVIRRQLTGGTIRDTGCSLKVMRREAIQALPLFEGMHRFLSTLLVTHGFDVEETPVAHHPRAAGRSKYGLFNRVFRASRDLFAVRWMQRRKLLLPIEEVIDR
jgi:glycosyltransferase involved in cell wall biosynthesis